MKKTDHIHMKIEPELKDRLNATATAMDVSISWLIRHAVKQYLAKQKTPVVEAPNQ